MTVATDLQNGKGDPSNPPTSLVVKQCVLVACCFLMLMNVLGFMAGLGVLFVDIIDTFQSTRATGSLIQSVCMGIVFGTGAVTSYLIRKVGAGLVCVIGGVVAAGGLVGSAFAPTLPVLILAVGVVTGLGLCTTSMVPLLIVGEVFNSRRGLALTIVSIGPGVGALVFPVLNSLLVERFGWRGAFLILAGIMLQATPMGMILSVLGRDVRCYKKRNERLKVENGSDPISTDGEQIDSVTEVRDLEDGNSSHRTANEDDVSGTHILCGSCLGGFGKRELTNDAGNSVSIDQHIYVNTTFTNDATSEHDVNIEPCNSGNSESQGSSLSSANNGFNSNDSFKMKNEIIDNMSKVNEEETGSDISGSTNKSNLRVQCNINSAKEVSNSKAQEQVNMSYVSEHIYDNPISVDHQKLNNGLQTSCNHQEHSTINGNYRIQKQNTTGTQGSSNNTSTNSMQHRFKSFVKSLQLDMFKEITFIILAMNVVLITAMFPSINFFLVDMTISKGFDVQTGSFLLSLIGFSNLAGRFLYLFLRPFIKVSQIMIFATLGFVISLCVLLLAWVNTLPLLLVAVVCYGLPFGAVSVSYPSLMFEIAGPDRYTMAVGYSETLSGVGALIGGPIAGSLKDWTDSYNSVVYAATAAGLLCSVSFYAVLVKRRCKKSG